MPSGPFRPPGACRLCRGAPPSNRVSGRDRFRWARAPRWFWAQRVRAPRWSPAREHPDGSRRQHASPRRSPRLWAGQAGTMID